MLQARAFGSPAQSPHFASVFGKITISIVPVRSSRLATSIASPFLVVMRRTPFTTPTKVIVLLTLSSVMSLRLLTPVMSMPSRALATGSNSA